MGSRSAGHLVALAVLNGAPLSLAAGAAPPPPAATARTSTPAGWRREVAPGTIPGVGSYAVALPPEMRKVPVTGVGSYVSEYRSRALTLLFDFGAHSDSASPSCRGRMRCSAGTLTVKGGRARRVRAYVPDPDGSLPYRADYEIPIPGGVAAARPITLRIHAECASAAACHLADRIVETIEIRSAR